jgi:putative membrane protein
MPGARTKVAAPGAFTFFRSFTMSNRFLSSRVAVAAAICGLGLTSVAAWSQAAAPATGGAAASGAAGSSLSAADRKFVDDAAGGGMAEVALGKLAEQKAGNAQVREFGSRMVTDHGKANDELKSLASAKGMQLPAAMPKKHQAAVDKLSKLSGTDFDKAYMKHMVDDHKMDVSKFDKQAKSGTDPDLKAWAAKTLPTLQDHLQQAQATSSAVNGGK